MVDLTETLERAPVPRKKDQPEHALSHWVAALLDRVMTGPGWWTAVETGTWMVNQSREARMNAENKRRARGIKPYHLDWYVYQKNTGVYVQFELKVDHRPTRPGQDDTITALTRNKIPTGVFETVPEVCRFLIEAGFEVHGNAAGIAVELHERYLAARRKAPARKSSPRKVVARSTVSVKQAHRLGMWRP